VPTGSRDETTPGVADVAGVAEAERNRQLVIAHFSDFVNSKDLSGIERNMSTDFYDHDGPDGMPSDRDGDRELMAGLHRMMPDLHVEIVDSLAEGDKVMVCNIPCRPHVKVASDALADSWKLPACQRASRRTCHPPSVARTSRRILR
jgi:predicted SnoaL-like aldol condensation-catalyzing enzyme